MAVTITDNRTIIDEGDANTAWTTTTTLTANTTSPTPVESTARLDMTVSSAIQNAYVTISSTDMSGDGYLLYFWISHRAEFDTTANVGAGIQIGDGTNRVAYGIMGSDNVGFSHSTGPVVWQCLVLDTGNLGAYSSTAITGSAGSLNRAAIIHVGLYFKTVVKAVGGAVNCFIDICRYQNPSLNDGAAINITGGTSGDPGTFQNIADGDRATGNQQAYGIVRAVEAGVFGVQGALRFGNSTGSSSSWFEDKDVTVAFESRKMTTSKYKIVIVDNGTGTTTFKLGVKVGSGSTATGSNGVIVVVPSGVGGLFDSGTDTDVTDVFIYGSTFSGFTNGITLGANQEFIGCTISGSAAVTAGGTYMNSTSVVTSTVAADASSVVWNVNTDTNGYLDFMKFTKGTNAHHALQLGTSSPTEVTFSGIKFTGFNASNGQNDSAVLVSRTSGIVTISITNNGDTPTYKSAGATVVIDNPKTLDIHVQDAATDPIQSAVVAVYDASDNSELVNELTDSGGDIIQASIAGGTSVYIRIRKSTSGTRYFPIETVATISVDTALTITMTEDTTAELP
jgi:hypothetical protein